MLEAKIVMLGDGGVGKTSLVRRWAKDVFDNRYIATIGVDIVSNTIVLKEREEIRLDCWDIAGQDYFKSIRSNFYQKASGAVLVFDVTDLESFKNLKNWIDETEQVLSHKIPFILVGNKIDLVEQRKISLEQIKKESEKLGMKLIIETSALTGDGVNKAFTYLAQAIIDSKALNTEI
ncbi:MAG: Rab family GTPase [Candidatus Hodarchaeales archaeon]|jgi:Ras-related protein Rab-1A